MPDSQQDRLEFSDRINPVVIKELRQSVRDGFTTAILMSFLGGLLLVLTLRCVTLPNGRLDTDAGRDAAGWMMMMTAVIASLVLPIQSAVRLHVETSTDRLQMMLITNVSYHRMFWGKVWVTMIKFAMLASMVLPFVTITMLMRGVSLPAVTWAVVINGFACFGATIGAMAIAALPDGMIGKVVAGLGTLLLLCIVGGTMVGITYLVVDHGSGEAIFGSLVTLVILSLLGFFVDLVLYSLAAQKRGRFNYSYYRQPAISTHERVLEAQRDEFERRYFATAGRREE